MGRSSPNSCPRKRGHATRGGFTLVELVVVLAIISMLALTALPTISRMWRSSQSANAENQMRGLVRSARTRALADKEGGLFFYVESNVQKIVFIEAEPPELTLASPDFAAGVTEQTAADRFRVLEDNVYEMPPPMRAVPLGVLIEDNTDLLYWTEDELANDNYDSPDVLTWDGAQNHRNFFTIIFSPEGHLLVGRDVLIHDPPANNPLAGEGQVTGLPVEPATQYQLPGAGPAKDLVPNGLLSMLVADGTNVALNFPSVDGLLVYDDSSFKEFPDGPLNPPLVDKRGYLKQSAQPLYITRQNAAIIRGPVGQTEP